MSKRNTGLDLIRCIALLLVLTFHFFLNNGYYYEKQEGVAVFLAGSVRWLSTSCIGLFLMLSGYLKSEKSGYKSIWKGLLPLLLGYLLAAVITIPVRHLCFHQEYTVTQWIWKLFDFSALYYGWYVEMFVGLTLLMPFINILLRQLNERAILLLAAVLLLLTAAPGATPLRLLPDHWRGIYPVTYYVLGAVIRRKQPRISTWFGIGGAILTALLMGGATVLSTQENLSEALTWEFADLWTVMISVCLFMSLYRLELPSKIGNILAFGASGCYGGYLLSHLMDGWCYKLVPQWHTPARYPLTFLLITVPSFVICVLAGWLLQRLTGRIAFQDKKLLLTK
ncbi:MAG: acyltransferase family protein [Oscillospiraceae bacterium]|nr:acyltransferase family protein [Oscillospiraceae bacterium]